MLPIIRKLLFVVWIFFFLSFFVLKIIFSASCKRKIAVFGAVCIMSDIKTALMLEFYSVAFNIIQSGNIGLPVLAFLAKVQSGQYLLLEKLRKCTLVI